MTRCNVSRSLIIHLWLDVLQSALLFGLTVLEIERSQQSKLFCRCSVNLCAEEILEMQDIICNEIFSLKKYAFAFSMIYLGLRLMICK